MFPAGGAPLWTQWLEFSAVLRNNCQLEGLAPYPSMESPSPALTRLSS
jgi:hypothetical protein